MSKGKDAMEQKRRGLTLRPVLAAGSLVLAGTVTLTWRSLLTPGTATMKRECGR